MTKEEKELLLKDICARLPYGITIYRYGDNRDIEIEAGEVDGFAHFLEYSEGYLFKPYLRPMSSMTKEEHGQYMEFIEWSHNDYDGTTITCINKERLHEYLDFIYSHHLDDNNFIEKGIALIAPEGIYKTE